MRKLKIFVSSILLLCFMQVNSVVYAANTGDQIKSQIIGETQEKNKIYDKIDKASINVKSKLFEEQKDYFPDKNIKIDSENNIMYGTPYNVYEVDGTKMDQIITGEKIDKAFLSDYYIECPVINNSSSQEVISTIQLRRSSKNEDWHLSMINGYLDPTMSEFSSNPTSIKDFLVTNNLSNIDKYIHFNLIRYSPLDFLYVTKGNDEYFISLLSKGTSLFGFTGLNIYTREEFNSILKKQLDNMGSGTGGIFTGSTKDSQPDEKVLDKPVAKTNYLWSIGGTSLMSLALFIFSKKLK